MGLQFLRGPIITIIPGRGEFQEYILNVMRLITNPLVRCSIVGEVYDQALYSGSDVREAPHNIFLLDTMNTFVCAVDVDDPGQSRHF